MDINEKKQMTKSEKMRKASIRKRNLIGRKIRALRLSFVFMLCFLAFVILYLKITKGEIWQAEIANQSISSGNIEKVINPNRGAIQDRFKNSLATSKTVYNVFIDVKKIIEKKEEEKQKTANALFEILQIPKEDFFNYIKNDPSNKLINTNYFVVKRKISRELRDELLKLELKDVHLEQDTERSYPNKNLGAQIVGFMRGDNKWGLEKQYDYYLQGVEGRSIRFAGDFTDAQTKTYPPQIGKTLITTIDINIQKFAEKAVLKAGKEYEPKNATAIVMEPNTGEILAWAEYPSVDLNTPGNIDNVNNELLKINWESLPEQEKTDVLNNIWTNYNIQSTFEPGSIYKPLVIAAALEEGKINMEDTYHCSGTKWFGSKKIDCWNKSGHGTQSLTQVLANSCNVGMMEIIAKLGSEKYFKYQKDFGYGEKTGIDLPYELSVSDFINTIEQLRNSVYLATNSMGQGFNATAIQSINSFAAIINGGNLMKPFIVSHVTDNDNNVERVNSPTIVRKVISKGVSDEMKIMLQAVVSKSGTGKQAIIEGYNIGGKTGTAQQGIRADNILTVSFVGFLTVEKPEYAAIVIINRAKENTEGSKSAAPILRDIFLDIINYKGIKPSGETLDSDFFGSSKEDFEIPNLIGKNVAEASETLNALGVDYEFVGSSGSKVKTQIPVAGTKITKTAKVHLYITSDSETEGLIKLPDVTGNDVEYAEEVLKNLGFKTNLVDADYKESMGNGLEIPTTYYDLDIADPVKNPQGKDLEDKQPKKTVVLQMPNSHIEIPKGTVIKLKIR